LVRREARGFGEYLEAARQAAGRAAAAGATCHAARAGEAGPEAGASPVRRRAEADGLDDGLAARRHGLDASERSDLDRRVEPLPGALAPAGGGAPQAAARAEAPRAADLAAAVAGLVVAVERRERALGPELRLDLGGRLSVWLARGDKGIEVVFAGEAGMARLARAELPGVLARLRQRGIAVARAEVRVAPPARPSGGAAEGGAGVPAAPGAASRSAGLAR
jgi:hypothetical protein